MKRPLDQSRSDNQFGALYEISGDETQARKEYLGRIKDSQTFGNSDPGLQAITITYQSCTDV